MSLLAALLLTAGATAPSRAEVRLAETSGNVLVLSAGRLERERGGRRVALGCTRAEGPGEVFALAADPAGLTFVAAERGLFVLGPWVDVLDPVEPVGDVPRGTPRAVHVDAARRVWFATEEGVGVLEPSHYYGRRLVTSAPPPGGACALAAGPGDTVALRCGAVEIRHDPAALPAPRVTRLALDGVELAPGATLARASGAELVLDVEGEAAGGASFRYRIDGHHVWRELPPERRIRVPNPGTRTLEVVALDEDLDRSEPFVVRLRVPYPRQYSGPFVLAVAATGAVLLAALFLARLRTPGGRFQPLRALVSAGLVLVLGGQLLAGLVPHAKGWPFVGFGMYTKKFERDGLVYAEHVVMLRPDGRESIVLIQSAGVTVDEPWEVLRPMIDRGAPALSAYLAAWRARNPAQVVCGVQVQAQRSRLTPAGPVAVAPLVLAHFREAPGG